MRILVYGAGVQGSLYAARLYERGHDVALLARGQRLRDVRDHGVILEDVATGCRTTTPVPIVERLDPADVYDLAIVPVRREQVEAILPVLAAARRVPTILFMHSHAGGEDDLVAAVGRERVLLGFPGASGRRKGPVIEYILIPQQPTTLGELDGRATPRVAAIAAALRGAGFRVAISRDMDAWLKTHAVLIAAVSGALYLADGDNTRLARTPDTVALFAHAVREGFGALRALGLPPPPRSLRAIFGWLPNRITVAYWRLLLGSPRGEAYFAWHTRTAWEEGKALAREVRALVRTSGHATPALDQLCTAIDAYAAAHALPTRRE
ncbi:MAG: ketopantoate reductase family protein [Chloroflexota bacterium]|nr:ketopantoate reductase family protein [Chloroflexota bacterium]